LQCGGLTDKFGVTWQVVPAVLYAMPTDPDAGKSKRVMKAMMGMIKLDIGLLTQAYEQG
jgi:predicted 3-demethylubiquinone-9 3-methyltransferase (glyoxalase superfamily)